jgi:hypothetical protein
MNKKADVYMNAKGEKIATCCVAFGSSSSLKFVHKLDFWQNSELDQMSIYLCSKCYFANI